MGIHFVFTCDSGVNELGFKVLHIKAGPTKLYLGNFILVILFTQCIIRDQPSVKKLAKRQATSRVRPIDNVTRH